MTKRSFGHERAFNSVEGDVLVSWWAFGQWTRGPFCGTEHE